MTPLLSFLSDLKQSGIVLRLENQSQLRIQARKGSLTNEIRAALRSRKVEIIHFLRQSNQDRKSLSAPCPRDESTPLPLSFAQQRLWFLDRLEGSRAYHMTSAVKLSGELNAEALRLSFSRITARHEVLRTTFTEREGTPYQVVHPHQELDLPVQDLCDIPPSQQHDHLLKLIEAENDRPFDLGNGPLVRLQLYRLGPKVHVLLCIFHHIISDGWSQGILIRELAVLYPHFQTAPAQAPAPLPPLPLQYGDFAAWQRSPQFEAAMEHQTQFWKRRLEGAPTCLEFPTDRPRPQQPSSLGDHLDFQLSGELVNRLRHLAPEPGVTLFMTLQAAFSLLLQRYSGQDDVVIGSPLLERRFSELEPLIGMFVNTLALRIDLAGDPGFLELRTRVKHAFLEAFDNRDVPFEQVVDTVQPERNMGHNPIFQVMLSFDTASDDELTLGNLELAPIEFEQSTTMFDFSLTLSEVGEGLEGQWVFSKDLFQPQTIRAISTNFEVLLTDIVKRPQCRISQLEVMSREEQARVLVEWNQTEIPRTIALFPRQFELIAARDPHQTALIYGKEQMSYGELDKAANQLAGYLIEHGLTPAEPVALCLPPSPHFIIALLAVLKAGGCYLPLDVKSPLVQLRYLAADSNARRMLSYRDEAYGRQLADQFAQVICMRADWPQITRYPDQAPTQAVFPDQLAYIIYTSGSSGRAKGVGICHASLAHYCQTGQEVFSLSNQDRVLQFCAITFDISVEEIFPTLATGAALILMTHSHALSSVELLNLIKDHQVSLISLPTAFWHELARDLFKTKALIPSSLRLMIVGGEKADLTILKKWRKAYGKNMTWINSYGPTEATVTASWYVLPPRGNQAEEIENLPIGKPGPRVRLYVLDRHFNPVPIGVPGFLYIAGEGLACAYLGKPALTANAFVPNPFEAESGGRLYRTGDWVRYLPDGNLLFVGRKDFQVKIRGYRIELGEIEAALRSHPNLDDAAVIAEDKNDRPYLIGYVVPNQEAFETHILRSFLKEKLPEYMIPPVFVVLPELPLTRSGKVDKRALPRPEIIETAPSLSRAKMTPAQEVMASIWSKLLHPTDLHPRSHFFELGGHSLLATRLLSRIREVFNLELPLKSLFEHPVLEDMTQMVISSNQEPGGVKPPITPLPRNSEPFETVLSYAQERLWFLNRLDPTSSVYNITGAMHLKGSLSLDAMARAFNDIVRRHESVRTVFPSTDGKPVQRVPAYQPCNLAVIDLSALPDGQRETELQVQLEIESSHVFDLAGSPPFRVRFFRLAQDLHAMIVNMHHIITDGWSLDIIQGELIDLYNAYSRGNASPLPDLELQYPDFAFWQRGWLTGEVLDKQLAYWKENLAGTPDLHGLMTDHPRPAVRNSSAAQESMVLDRSLSNQLRALGHQYGATLNMTVLSAFVILLSRYSHRDDIVVGSPIANRNHGQTESLVGFFVNTLVLRTDLSNDPNFTQVLARVRRVILDAGAHQDTPFEQVVECLQPERNLSHSPLFQIMFNFQNAGSEEQSLAGLEWLPFDMERSSISFDFSLGVTDTGQDIEASWAFSTELFERATIQRMAGHFNALLESIIASPQSVMSKLSLMSPSERNTLLYGWNEQGADIRGGSFVSFFQQKAAGHPEHTALIYGERTFSYRELNEQSNQLAVYLREHGLKYEEPVGLCLNASPLFVLGALAVLKAGATYVPLDPKYPAEHLNYLVEDSGLRRLLTSQDVLTVPALPARVQALYLDTDRPEVEARSRENLNLPCEPEQLAYVIYTSGSTGRPKGVGISHGSLVHLCQVVAELFKITPEDRFLQFCSINFDTSIKEIFCTLSAGATVVLRPTAQALSSFELRDLVEAYKVTLFNLPVAFWRQFAVDLLKAKAPLPPSLRLTVVGGDKADPEIVKQWRRAYGAHSDWINGYGPTETTVTASWCPMTTATWRADAHEPLSIGRPAPGVRFYVLDHHLMPVPVGVPGALYIAGVGLARGYLGKGAMTAARFVPNPFALQEQAGDRLYNTGDTVYYLPDGNVAFIGRTDLQVKIRGYRVEPGEIEAVLATHPDVGKALVIAEKDQSQDRLVAYVVSPSMTADLAREFLQKRVPAFMIPSIFVILDQLPLTPSGKVDRHALPKPKAAATPPTVFQAPRDLWEKRLASLWSQVLNVPKPSVGDHFFEQGGHSLLAVKLMSLVEQQFSRSLPLATLFQTPTLEALASRLRISEGKEDASPLVPIHTADAPTNVFMVHPVGGQVHWYFELAQKLADTCSFFGLQAPGLTSPVHMGETVEEVAACYVAAVRSAHAGPYVIAGWSLGGTIAFEMAHQLKRAGETVTALILLDAFQHAGTLPSNPIDDLLALVQDSGVDPSRREDWRVLLSNLPEEERLPVLFERLSHSVDLPPHITLSALEKSFRVHRLHKNAVANYSPQSYDGRVLLIHAADSGGNHHAEEDSRIQGWAPLCLQQPCIYEIPGDHYSIFDTYVDDLASLLKTTLQRG